MPATARSNDSTGSTPKNDADMTTAVIMGTAMFKSEDTVSPRSTSKQTHAISTGAKNVPVAYDDEAPRDSADEMAIANAKAIKKQAANKRTGSFCSPSLSPDRENTLSCAAATALPSMYVPSKSMLSDATKRRAGPMSPKNHTSTDPSAPASRMVHTISSGSWAAHTRSHRGITYARYAPNSVPPTRNIAFVAKFTEAMSFTSVIKNPYSANKTAMASESPQSSGMLMRGNEPRERTSKNAAHKAPNTYDISVNESMNGVTCVIAGAKNTWVTKAKLHAIPTRRPSREASRIRASSACSMVAAFVVFFTIPPSKFVEQAKRLLSRAIRRRVIGQ